MSHVIVSFLFCFGFFFAGEGGCLYSVYSFGVLQGAKRAQMEAGLAVVACV